MASMTIRNRDDALKERLRIRAASHGRSMEDEARDILRAALSSGNPKPMNLAQSIRRRVASVGGAGIDIPAREEIRDAPDFGR